MPHFFNQTKSNNQGRYYKYSTEIFSIVKIIYYYAQNGEWW